MDPSRALKVEDTMRQMMRHAGRRFECVAAVTEAISVVASNIAL